MQEVSDYHIQITCLVLCFNWQEGSTPMPQWPNRLIFFVDVFFFFLLLLFFFSIQGSTPIDPVSIARDRIKTRPQPPLMAAGSNL